MTQTLNLSVDLSSDLTQPIDKLHGLTVLKGTDVTQKCEIPGLETLLCVTMPYDTIKR